MQERKCLMRLELELCISRESLPGLPAHHPTQWVPALISSLACTPPFSFTLICYNDALVPCVRITSHIRYHRTVHACSCPRWSRRRHRPQTPQPNQPPVCVRKMCMCASCACVCVHQSETGYCTVVTTVSACVRVRACERVCTDQRHKREASTRHARGRSSSMH